METGTPKPGKSRRALLWVSTSYFGEGLPWSFLHQLATQFLTEIRASNTQISSTSLLHLAVTFKFLWSPLVDLFGRLRSWMVALQVVLGVGMIVVGTVASPKTLPTFWVLLAILAVIHATHDIACDGFYLKGLDRHDQALYSGVRTAAYRVAMLVGTGALVFLAAQAGWKVSFSACGVLMIVVGLVNAIVLPYPPTDDAKNRRRDRAASAEMSAADFLEAFSTFLTQPQAARVISFMFLYRLGDIMMGAMSQPMLRDIGVDLKRRALLTSIGIISFIAASLLGGALIARRSFQRCFVPMTYIQNFTILLYVALAAFAPPFRIVLAIVVIEQFASGIGNAAHVVFLMRRSRSAFSASHYAFATAVVSLGSTVSGFLSGPLNTKVGHVWFFTCAFLASVPGLILVLFVPRDDIDATKQVQVQPDAKSKALGA
jgi:PAT family beta-lactamase induction signal transducer AmpG